jgi:hypothetical protein
VTSHDTQQLIRMERLVAELERQTHAVLAKVGRADQKIRMFNVGSVCTTTFSGQIRDCQNAGLAGGTARFVGAVSGIDYGTFTANGSGNFTAAIVLDASDTSVDLYAGQPSSGGRFDDSTTPAVTLSAFALCGAANAGNRNAVPGAGYACAGSGCKYPLAKTLKCDDDGVPGTFDLVYDTPGFTNKWLGTHGGKRYVFDWSGSVWRLELLPAVGGGSFGVVPHYAATCPDPAGPTLFDADFHISGTLSPGVDTHVYEV